MKVELVMFFAALNHCLTLYLSISGKLVSKYVLTNFILFLGSWISICIWSRSQF